MRSSKNEEPFQISSLCELGLYDTVKTPLSSRTIQAYCFNVIIRSTALYSSLNLYDINYYNNIVMMAYDEVTYR
jgi:hypothetical protein